MNKINRRLPALWSSITIFPFVTCILINCIGQIIFHSEGHCLKVAHFFLKEAKLLLSKAICFSISMECRVFLITPETNKHTHDQTRDNLIAEPLRDSAFALVCFRSLALLTI